ncbi:Argininosuccinate lyase (plasmid) [Variovorax sp. SRS16]|uniref:tripartite tricarboxylate transporter substrate binding protein n=1 Tax=Variovorax sp. SRS16 TaxID=282217 RepID=UPI001319A956|nr:tripartite tricarboxylate transporter substrate binding protein [Variovorax sp. SRS16]VTU46451.1 Argininosuccinate lyase [Variovorax sp. SRS16]
MISIRRHMLAAGLLALIAGAAGAQAADYPSKPVRIVVPFAAAGSTDLLARVLARALSTELGQNVLIDNRPGASGNIGADIVAKAAPDGYTLLYTSTNLTANPALMPVPYDVVRDFTPISRVAFLPLALFKSPTVHTQSVAELVTLIKAHPGTFNFSSSGKGGAPHLAGELFRMSSKLDMVHVPYNGAGPALNDVAAGTVQLTFTTYTSAQALMAAKKVDVVAVANRTRLAVMPDVPTFEEAGIKGMEIGTMNGLLAPAHTPPAVVAKIYAALTKAGQSPEFRKQFIDQGGEVLLENPAQFTIYIRDDLERWKTLIPKIGGLQ